MGKQELVKGQRNADDGKPQQTDGAKKSRINILAQPKEPTFYIAGGNGAGLVENCLSQLGWKRITNKYDDTFKLKWVECKSAINYNLFRQGEQLVNRIPNCALLTNKLGLLNSLQRFERVSNLTYGADNRLCSADFVPDTFRIDEPSERNLFFESYQEGEIWICKPCGLNQGKGIYLVRDLEEFKKSLDERDEKNNKPSHRPMARIVQRYLTHPLLLDNKKFDIRAYMLIASTTPYLVCYHKGYARLCLYNYTVDSENMIGHLTNQFIQKKDSNYSENKEDTVWSMDKFNTYINETIAEKKDLEPDWVYSTLTNRMKQIMSYCFNSVKHKLKCRLGFFDLYGFDFMVDENMKIWLIEVNANPCLATNCQSLIDIVPGVVRESLYLSIECFEKTRKGQPLHPLHCLTNCEILYDGSSNKPQKVRPISPRRVPQATKMTTPRVRSHSPVNRRQTGSPYKELVSNTIILSPVGAPYKDTLSNRLSQSTPGPIQSSAATTTNPGTTSVSRMEEHFKGTSRIYNTSMSRSTTPRVPATFSRAPKATTLIPTAVGLRGALPTTKTQPPIQEIIEANNAANSDVFKFKMTHAALMSSVRSERNNRSARPKSLRQMPQSEEDNEEPSSAVLTTRSQPCEQSNVEIGERKKDFHRSASRAIEDAHMNLEVYLQRLRSPSPLVKESPVISNEPNESSKESKIYRGSPTLNKTKLSSKNESSVNKSVSKNAEDKSKSGGVISDNRGQLSKHITSVPSIPTLKKDIMTTKKDEGGIVGVSIKKNERGS